MAIKTVEELVKKYRYDYYLYSWNIFEMRIKEEMVRSDLSNSGFAYIEIALKDKFNDNATHDDEKKIWRAILSAISQWVRGSDVKGYLSEDRGIGLLLLDSHPDTIYRIGKRMMDSLRELKVVDILNPGEHENILQGFVYPDDSGEKPEIKPI